MADCFWTDLVGVVEDCGGAPPRGPAVLLGVGATHNNEDIIPFTPATGARIAGTLKLDTVTLYQAADSCSLVGFLATTDAALDGTTVDVTDAYGTPVSTFTWKLLSSFSGLSVAASASNVVLGPDTDGMGGSFITFADLIAQLYPSGGYSNNGGVLVATLHDTDTGDTWEATWVADTCY